MVMDLSQMVIRQHHAEMMCSIMDRISAEARNPDATPQDLTMLMSSYADLTRATNGSEFCHDVAGTMQD